MSRRKFADLTRCRSLTRFPLDHTKHLGPSLGRFKDATTAALHVGVASFVGAGAVEQALVGVQP